MDHDQMDAPPAAATTGPADHPLRQRLADELHARPPAPVQSPAVASCLALLDTSADAVFDHLCALATRRGVAVPAAAGGHAIVEFVVGGVDLRAKWERHGEFTSLTLVAPLAAAAVAAVDDAGRGAAFPSALDALPPDWRAALPGKVIAAADIVLLPLAADAPPPDVLARWLDADALAGARALDGAARIYTDFGAGGVGGGGAVTGGVARPRWLVLDAGMGRAQSARVVQRIVDIEIYRMMALLAFPLARAAFPRLDAIEQQLARITAATAELHGQADVAAAQAEERRLLDELTRVAAELERSIAASAFRFSAAQAYWEIVRARVAEFREQRIGDLRSLGGFLGRRLAPAMNSCAAAARRQEELSARIERASALLRTRVDIAREEQNQQLLAAMERRGKLSLRLQQTVEGLSVAALTYYAAGLIGYLAKPLKSVWPQLNPDWVVAAAIPLLAFAVWRGVRRVRRELGRD